MSGIGGHTYLYKLNTNVLSYQVKTSLFNFQPYLIVLFVCKFLDLLETSKVKRGILLCLYRLVFGIQVFCFKLRNQVT